VGDSRKRIVHCGRVHSAEWITPRMIRVMLGGEGLEHFEAGDFTDRYVKLLFPPPGVVYPDPTDLEAIKRDLPKHQRPIKRTFTVRTWDAERRLLTLDFVYHGDEGVAGVWAAEARPGDKLYFQGPGGKYAPDPAAAHHLLAGDESALPAIAASLERLPEGCRAQAFIEVEDFADEQALPVAPGVEVHWLHRAGRPVGSALVQAVREAAIPDEGVEVFLHGEAHCVKELRRHLKKDRGVDKKRMSASGYWRLGSNEDHWQATKAEWNQRVEEEEARLAAAGA
jgi:NADPH-dependent ferric siderophore reductase